MTTYINSNATITSLGERIRNISLASLSQNVKSTISLNDTNNIALPVSADAKGRLELNVVEARNLTIQDARKADTYCIVHYEGNTTSTLDKIEDELLPSMPSLGDTDGGGGAFKAFEIMMKASSPKWMHRVNFDVTSGNKEITLFVYDRGNKLPNGEDRFLGMSTISPCLVNKRTVELIFPLHGRPGDDQEVTGDVRIQVTYSHTKRSNITREDFLIKRMVGEGPTGKVYEVVKKDSNRVYAMKVLSKRLLVAEDELDSVFTERNMLVNELSSPFIAGLKYSFQTTNHLFLVMDYFPGGELFDLLERERCINESHCQMLAAEIICAFDNIHAHDIIYRNLKPESILLDAHGHIALTDFGMCKQTKNNFKLLNEIPENITQEYLAPEMILGKPYGKSADWWSLGVLVFELLTGYPPFHSIDEDELFSQILKSPIKFPIGSCISNEAKDFVTRLLDRDPAKRLGAQGGVEEVKTHEFFSDVNWNTVYKKQMQLPFAPDVEEQLNEEAIAAAAAISLPMTKKESSNAHIPLVSDQSRFKGFSFMREENTPTKSIHRLGIKPEDEDPEIDFWFRQ
ncbi:unnamed protein product [Mucor hiemalis]